MAERGDEVAEGLESQIREVVDRMVADIRSTITDVREAVDQQLDAAMQSVQADANSLSFRSILQAAIQQMEPAASAAAPQVEVREQVRHSAARAKEAIQAVERAKSQVEILNALLEQSLDFGSRAALFILKGESFSGWKGAGFSTNGGSDEAIKRFVSQAGTIGAFDTILREEKVVSWDGADLARMLGVTPPAKGVLVPMVIKDKVAAAMYVDVLEGAEERYDQAAIELLVFSTGLLIDTLAIRKKSPSPSLSGESVEAPPPPTVAPSPTPAAERRAPEPPPAPPVEEPTPPSEVESPSAPAASPQPVSPGLVSPRPEPDPPARPQPVEEPPRAGAGLSDTADRPSTQFVPPPGLRGGGAFSSPGNEQARKHDEARRFARLLVSEIKLYNEAKVEQGRKNRDLYERLKEDIDRSRQMYDERIAEDVRKASNYFYDELVRILADGDGDALGL